MDIRVTAARQQLLPQASADNLRRLSAALEDLEARIRTESDEEGLPFDHDDAESLRRSATWNLICRHGEFDIAFQPSGFGGGYEELAARAHRVRVEGIEVRVANLEDVILSKEAAGRSKHLRALPSLYRHHQRRGSAGIN